MRATSPFGHRDGERSSPRRVLITRAADQAADLASALRQSGLDPVAVPAIAIEFEPPHGDLDSAASVLHSYRWVVVTSANGARAILKAAERILTELGAPSWAAIGPATRGLLEREGVEVAFQPTQSNAIAMAAELSVDPGDRILVVRGDLADEDLSVALRARGAEVDDVVGYRTREAPETSRALLRSATADGAIAAVAFTSGSTIRGLMSLAKTASIDVRSFPAVCIGPETADEARSAGFRILAVASTPDATGLARATAAALAREQEETP
jgi:uroporphyrinogen-III synthase